jgi:hypothetical protein
VETTRATSTMPAVRWWSIGMSESHLLPAGMALVEGYAGDEAERRDEVIDADCAAGPRQRQGRSGACQPRKCFAAAVHRQLGEHRLQMVLHRPVGDVH